MYVFWHASRFYNIYRIIKKGTAGYKGCTMPMSNNEKNTDISEMKKTGNDSPAISEEHHKDHKVANAIKSIKWLLFWVALAMAFCGGIYLKLGKAPAIDFLGGYLIEFSLSIDNVFVFLMIFMSFGISEHAQHRVLGWGILSAIVLRFFFIFFGVSVVNKFEWVLYIFGALLIFSGAKMFKSDDEEKDPHDSKVLQAMSKVMPMSSEFDGEKFFTKVTEKGWLRLFWEFLC